MATAADNVPQRMPATLRKHVRDRFSAFCKKNGLIQVDFLGGIIEFVMQLDDRTLLSLFGGHIEDDDVPAVCRALLERFADGDTKPINTRPGGSHVPKTDRTGRSRRSKAQTSASR